MRRPILTGLRPDATQGAMRRAKLLLAAPVVLAGSGCVQVSAPDKPIEINLNINIRQEVVVRLQQDVKELIDKNPGVF
jgi:YnbE-like lipoprotein